MSSAGSRSAVLKRAATRSDGARSAADQVRLRILITGASAGIGAALARHWAAAGVTLGLVARRAERLEALATELRGLGATVFTYTADVREREAMAEVVRNFADAAGGISLAVANAGISRSDGLQHGDAALAGEVIATNVNGVLNTLVPAVPLMIEAGAGHLVTIGSVAGFRGIPGKGAYCASKAAVKTLMDAYRPALRRHGIRVTTICPGWVTSELTAANAYPMPFMMGAAKAARLIDKAVAQGRATYVFPWQMRLALPLIKFLPDRFIPNLSARK